VRSSSKATCHHVYPLLAGPPTTMPWLPAASEPIAGVPGVGIGMGCTATVAATVMPVASVGVVVTISVTD
jgi:hypothetical protein